ncbi:MAG: glycoside hydrolase family 15 protein [Chitinispirillaceae bacterium]|nr:glycoside hydrolase family 15 protein [Chitinispirillaceae bacterium]
MDNLDYGIIGNCMSAALVSREATLEWLCLPFFDSSSVFASILDKKRGGHFHIGSDDTKTISQKYMRYTNLLSTVVETGRGTYEIVDFMPRYRHENGEYHCPPDVIRYLRLRSGTPSLRVDYRPRLDYGAGETTSVRYDHFIKSTSTHGCYESMYLYTSLDHDAVYEGLPIPLTEDAFFLVSYNQKIAPLTNDYIALEYQRTKAYWMNWASHSTFSVSRYHDEIIRSLLVLKLLSFQPTGAILAAATTSLPEAIGEVRNWDYRYCWIRDASMAISTLARLGHENVSKRFMRFILDIVPYKDEKIQIMYGIRGEKQLDEYILDHLSGYENSRPVRVGNAAFHQKQNDIYGVLLDIILYTLQHFTLIPAEKERLWTVVRSVVRMVSNSWMQPDRGIWEYRSDPRDFLFSKLLCWCAMERGAAIADLVGAPAAYARQWRETAGFIRHEIEAKGWNERQRSFTQFFGSDHYDATALLLEPYGFLDAHDQRYIATVRAVEANLCENGLMLRYRNEDDFGKPTSSFTICNFWMINALFKTGDREKARLMFERVLSAGNHVGLFSEDIDMRSGRLLGNFPQAYSHLALIESILLLYGE